MGRKERREREEKRESYATQRSSAKKRNMLIAIGVLALIGAIVAYAAWMFVTMDQNAPGGPENAGALGSAHNHAAILVKIFGDEFDFSAPAYQIKSPYIHFEGRDGTTVHKHATGVTLGYLFDSLKIHVDKDCFVFQDGRSFCNSEDYSLKFFVDGMQVDDIRPVEIQEDDRILISYGGETEEEIKQQLEQLDNQPIIK